MLAMVLPPMRLPLMGLGVATMGALKNGAMAKGVSIKGAVTMGAVTYGANTNVTCYLGVIKQVICWLMLFPRDAVIGNVVTYMCCHLQMLPMMGVVPYDACLLRVWRPIGDATWYPQ
jgi:hypothetical protein